MPDIPSLPAFIAAAAVLALTPGVDTAMVLRAAAVDGPRPAAFAALGIALGCLIWAGAVALGLGALLQASETAYTGLKWAGAAYLLWLGLRLILQPRHRLAMPEDGGMAGFAALRRGFLTNILNPKVGVFYVTFLPQFIPQGADIAAWCVLLALIHVTLSLIWFAALIAATAPLGRLLRRPRVVAAIDRAAGGVFVLFSIRLALSKA